MTLTQWRKSHRINQASLANRLGVSKNTISRWEVGERIPCPALMRAIHAATDGKVTPNDLILDL